MILILWLLSIAAAQTVTPTVPATAQPGTSVQITIQRSLPAAVALQWSLTLPSGWIASSASTPITDKTLACNAANLLCLVYSAANVAPITAFSVATISVAIPASAVPGTATISTGGVLGASATGTVINGTGGSATIQILDRRDVDGDGVVNASDVQAAVSQVFGTCTTGDVVSPAGCDVVDIVAIALKALGQVP